MSITEREPITPEKPYLLVRPEGLKLDELDPSFEALPPDRYLRGSYTFRHRKFDKLVASSGQCI